MLVVSVVGASLLGIGDRGETVILLGFFGIFAYWDR